MALYVNGNGRLVKDPENRKTQSGVSVTRITIAAERNYKTGDERQTDFIECTAWRGLADVVAKYFHKGDPIHVTGTWETEKWVNAEGQQRKRDFVQLDGVEFVPQQKAKAPGEQTYTPPTIPAGYTNAGDEKLPF